MFKLFLKKGFYNVYCIKALPKNFAHGSLIIVIGIYWEAELICREPIVSTLRACVKSFGDIKKGLIFIMLS